MKAIYIKSTNKDSLESFCSSFKDVIGPREGRVEFMEEGELFPSKGEPGTFYACVIGDVDLPSGIQECEYELGVDILGVWATEG